MIGDQAFKEMNKLYLSLGQTGLYLSHYDLNEKFPDFPTQLWREFLTEPEVQRYRTNELSLLNEVELNKLMKDAGTKGGQVGVAQLVNALAKVNSDKPAKDGPIFIYAYIPPNENQKQATDFVEFLKDPFME